MSVYFSDVHEDPNLVDCSKTYPFERQVPRTLRVALAALTELLRGPTPEELRRGARTSLPPGVQLRRVTIRDGLARVDLSRELVDGVAGSCRVAALRAQLEATLLAFPSVQRVELSVEGEDATLLLQP